MAQRSEEWFEMRRGKITASRIEDVMATGRSGAPSASRDNYLIDLALERVTGVVQQNGYQSHAMQRGTELEPIARAEYEIATGDEVELIDFAPHPTLEWTGASPDGLIKPDGIMEVKCPEPKQHWAFLLTRQPARGYMLQMHWQMVCVGATWCDYVSYCPVFPESLRLAVQRVEYSKALGDQIHEAVRKALVDIERIAEDMRRMQA